MQVPRLLPLTALLTLCGGLAHAQSSLEARVIVRWKADAAPLKSAPLRQQALPGEVFDVLQRRADHLGQRARLNLQSGRRALDARTQVLTARGLDSATLARRLARDPQVELVAVDQIRRASAVPNDAIYAAGDGIGPAVGQWYLKPPSSPAVSAMNAQSAWDRTTGAAVVTVAVIDTGIRFEHPDLAANLLPGYDMIGAGGSGNIRLAVANDGDLADADASDPGDWVSQADINGGTLGTGCTSADIGNSSWHGTRVAGLIGAVGNNGIGIAGVSWVGKLLPIRALGKCGGYDSDILAGVRWAVGAAVPGLPLNPNPAKVINMSLGSSGACNTSNGQLYREAFAEANAAGAVVVVAAGNSAGEPVDLPANCTGALAVTGLRHVGTKVGFSSMGPEVAIGAPGGNCVNLDGSCLYPLVSTTNSGATGPAASTYTYNSTSVGTSFATPLVSGAAALMFALNPTLTPTQVRSLMQSTARPFPTTGGGTTGEPPPPTCPTPQYGVEVLECYCTTTTCGAGMIDANALLAAVPAYSGPPAVVVDASSSTVAPGGSVALSSRVAAYGGRSIASYQWGIVSGGTLASLSGSTQPTATLNATAGGSGGNVVLQLSVTDSGGQSSSSQLTISASAAPAPGPSPSPSPSPSPAPAPSGGGGGGSSSPFWLALLGLATALLGPRRSSGVTRPPPRP